MNLQLVFRNLARRKSRTWLGVLGVLATLALLTTVQIALDSISGSYIDLVSLQAGKADVLVTLKDSSLWNPRPFNPALPASLLGKAPELKGVSPRLLGFIRVRFDNQETDAVLVGLDHLQERRLDISGVKWNDLASEATCALSKGLADKLQIKPGQRLSLSSPENYSNKDVTCETVLERQQVIPQQIRDYVVVSLADARELLSNAGEVHVLAGALKDPRAYYNARDVHGSVAQLKSVGAKLAADLGPDYDVRLPKAAALTGFQDFTSPLRAVFGVFAVLALVITGLLIYSLLSVAVEERIREYAIMRAVGATNGQIRRMVIGESVVLCLIGVVPGVLLGALAAKVLLALLALAMGGAAAPSIPFEIRPVTLIVTAVGGAALAIGSSLFPAFQATRWRIADALDPMRRGQIAEPVPETRSDRPLIWVGVALSILSGVVFFVLPGALFSGNPSLIGTIFLSLLLSMLLGLTLAALGVQPLLQRILLLLIGPAFGPASELAGRNLRRHRRRHMTTVLLFSLSVSLVVFIASLVALASRTAVSLVELNHGADLRIHAPQPGGENLKQSLSMVEGVASVSEARYLHSRSEYGTAYDVVVSDLVGIKQLWVIPYGIDSSLPGVLYESQLEFAAGDPTALMQVSTWTVPVSGSAPGTNAPPAILSLAVARFLDVQPGDTIGFTFRLGSDRTDARFRVAAVCRTLPGFENFRGRVAQAVGSGVLLPMSEFQRCTRSAPADAFQAVYFVKTLPGIEQQRETARRIRENFDLRHRFNVKATAEQKHEAKVIYWATQVFFGLLLAVAVTIAVFALIASMTTTVMERTREIGVLKALGMVRKDLFRLFVGEAVTLTLSAGIAGGAIGFALAWFFVMQAALLMEIPVVFTLPYITLLATLVISLLAGVAAAYLPTRALLRRTAAEILRG
jgi:putative ABC transport system permease protein